MNNYGTYFSQLKLKVYIGPKNIYRKFAINCDLSPVVNLKNRGKGCEIH